jgi:hypothetical protein
MISQQQQQQQPAGLSANARLIFDDRNVEVIRWKSFARSPVTREVGNTFHTPCVCVRACVCI